MADTITDGILHTFSPVYERRGLLPDGWFHREERIITIEDSAELQIQGVENLVRLEAKPANMEGNRAITIRDLIRTALRMAPNRIIVGEIRGEEAVDLLQAFICTI